MILGALHEYYRRRSAEEDSGLPLRGFSAEKISFALVLRPDGSVAEGWDLRAEDKRRSPRIEAVPKAGAPRTSAVKAFFLWDKTSYLLGADLKMRPDQTAAHFKAAQDLHHRLLDGVEDDGARALLAFFDTWQPERTAEEMARLGLDWESLSGTNLVFRLDKAPGYLHQRPALVKIWELEVSRQEEDQAQGQCLVTGEVEAIPAVHPSIKGVNGAQTSGASIVSFNQSAFTSYGHSQAMNAPVGASAAFAYTAALNHLLDREKGQRLQIGDATVLYWAERKSDGESLLPHLIDPPLEDDSENDQATTGRLRTILESLRDGITPRDRLAGLDPSVRFYLLGLSAPAQARLSVRFWEQTTLGELLDRIALHHRALKLERQYPKQPDFMPLWLLLRQTAVAGKSENVSPGLAAAMTRAVLTGTPYPRALLAAVLERIRHENGEQDSVSYLRVALLKAYLMRPARALSPAPQKEDYLVSLDPDNPSPAYRLGRLFAVLERAQQLALGANINATIKDRYFGTASASPRAVFPHLIRVAQHHLAKADNAVWLDRKIGEITDGLSVFPAHLGLEDQALFTLGYYHQRNDLWRKKTEQAVP